MSLDNLTAEIAQTAARIVVEEGLEWGPAKQRAVRQLALPSRTALPDNDQLRAVREYIELFLWRHPATRAAGAARAGAALDGPAAGVSPHLAGAVWRGTATRLSDIYLQLFCDDSKSAEIALINNQVNYRPSFTGDWLSGKTG